MLEEVGITMDTLFSPIFVGGWQMARARRSRQRQLQGLCDRAVSGAPPSTRPRFPGCWFALSDLEGLYAAHDSPSPAASISSSNLSARSPTEGHDALAWLHTYAQGRGSQSAPFNAQARMRSGLSLPQGAAGGPSEAKLARAAAASGSGGGGGAGRPAVRSKL